MPTVFIPVAFRSFTNGRDRVEIDGAGSLRQVFERLDRECPGIGDQLIEDGGIRAGLAIFINDEQTSEGLLQPVPADGTIYIQPAMGGGAPPTSNV